MKRRENRDGLSSSQGRPTWSDDNQVRLLQDMMKDQQKQIEILHQGLLMTSHGRRPKNVSDFRRLQPLCFLEQKIVRCRAVVSQHDWSPEGSL